MGHSVQIDNECMAAMQYIHEVHAKQRKQVYTRQARERASLTKALLQAIGTKLGTDLTARTEPLAAPSSQAGGQHTQALPPLSPPSSSSGSAGSLVGLPICGHQPPAAHSWGSAADAEVLHREEAARLWGQREEYTIQAAFTNQLARVDAEWKEYLLSMHKEWAAEYVAITGHQPDAAAERATGADMAALHSTAAGGDKKNWLNKAKQEQLIHTAPVIRPKAGSAMHVAGSGHAAPTSSSAILSSSAKRRVAELNEKYALARASVVAQQSEVSRWVNRQCRRMLMQVRGAARERAAAAAHEGKESRAWYGMCVVLYNAGTMVAAQGGLHLHTVGCTDSIAFLQAAVPHTAPPATAGQHELPGTPSAGRRGDSRGAVSYPAATRLQPAAGAPLPGGQKAGGGTPPSAALRLSPVTTPNSGRIPQARSAVASAGSAVQGHAFAPIGQRYTNANSARGGDAAAAGRFQLDCSASNAPAPQARRARTGQ